MRRTAPRRLLVPALVLLLLTVQLVVLYAPQAPGPSMAVPYGDKLVHAAVFAAPVLVAGLSMQRWWSVLAVACAVHAPVSEVIQHVFLRQRSGDVWDAVADLVGVGAAAMAVRLWLRRPRRRRL